MAIKNFNIQHGLSLGDTLITIVDDNANVYASTLTVSTNSNLGNLATANYFSGDGGYLSNITAVAGAAATVTGNAQPNITSVGNLVNLQIGNLTSGPASGNGIVYFNGNGDASYSGNVTALNFIGDGSQITGVLTANYANYAGNVIEADQPNITTVGTLQYLTVSGDTNIQGNLTVDGTLTYIDSTTISLVDPILELGGGPDGEPLATNDTNDRGTLLHYYTTKPMDAFMGWKNSDGQFVFGSNVIDIASSVTINEYANVKAANFLGNLIGTRANLSNINFTNNVTGGNLVSANYFTGTLTTATQPNITSVGELSNLTVSGKTTLSTVSNVVITGGTADQFLQTDGSGNLSWVTISSATISEGTSNVLVNNDGNVTISSDGVANVLTVSSTGITIIGDLTDIGNGTMNTLSITGTTVSTNSTTGALTVAGGVGIEGNINTASNLTVNGISSLSNVTINGNLVAGNANFSLPVTITSPADSTDYDTGALILTEGGLGVQGNINSGGDVQGATLTGTITTAAQTNITSLGTLTNLGVTGNIVSANANVSNLVVTSNSNFGNVGNVKITGGSTGQYLQTDGTGNLVWQDAASTNAIVAGTSNVRITSVNGPVTISSNANPNVIVVDGNVVNVNGTLTISDTATTNALIVSSVVNSTSYTTGALTIAGGLGVAGNIFTDKNLTVAGNTFIGNTTIQGTAIVQGTSEFQSIVTLQGVTDSTNSSTGVLVLTTGGLGVAGNINSAQNVSGATLTGTLTTNAQTNITSVGILSSLVVTGNITAGNVDGANLVSANYLTGTLTTAAQPNITSVGTLLNLTVDGNIGTSNLSVSGKANLGSVANITISGGANGRYLQTDGAGNVSWKEVSTSSLVNGTSNIVINPSGNVSVSANGASNVVSISNNQVSISATTDSTSYSTGALLVNGGVGIAGNLFINGLLNVSGDFQVGSLNTSGAVEHTGAVTFTQVTYFSNTDPSTSTTTGAVQITGGVGIQGNIFGGNIISAETTILRNGRNVPTFVSSTTMPTNALLGDEWYDQDNDRIYQYIYDGTYYNWIDVSGGYIAANVQAQGGTLVVRDSNGNVYANTISANNLSVANLTITGTAAISSMVSAGQGISVSNSSDTLIDTFPKTSYRSAKYIVSARNDDGFEVAEMLIIHDNSVSFIQTYGDVSTGIVQDIVTFSSNIVGANVCLYATGSNSNTYVNLISTYVTD